MRRANTLIEAMGWIRRFRGKTTVIKLGGSMLDDEEALMHILLDVIFMESVGMKPVIVHGDGTTSVRTGRRGFAARLPGQRVLVGDAQTLEGGVGIHPGEVFVGLGADQLGRRVGDTVHAPTPRSRPNPAAARRKTVLSQGWELSSAIF